MPKSLEERVSYLEGTVSGNSRNIEDLRDLMIQLNHRVDRLDGKTDQFREELAERITGLKEVLDKRINATNSCIGALEEKMSR